MSVFQSVEQEAKHWRETQEVKFNYTYAVSGIIDEAATEPLYLTIEDDADFLIERITGSCYGPTDADGIPQVALTDFPMPGIAVGAGFAGRGLTMMITDVGAGRPLTNGFVPVELLLTPGYDISFHLPYPVKYYLKKRSSIQFDVRNRDTQTNARHQIDIALNGTKYMVNV